MSSQAVQYQYIKKVLVVCLEDLGQVIDALPMIKNIKDQRKDKIVHVIVNNKYKSLLENITYIDKVLTITNTSKITEKIKYAQSLSNERYNLILCYSTSISSYIGSFLAKPDYRVGLLLKDPIYNWAIGKLLIGDPLEFDMKTSLENKKIPHQIELGFKLAEHIGVKITSRDISLKMPEKDEAFVSRQINSWNWNKRKQIFCIPLTKNWITEDWNRKNFMELVNYIQKNLSSQVIFTAHSNTLDIANELKRAYSTEKDVKVIIGLTIPKWLELIKQSSYVIAVDKSIIQVSSSQKTPTIAIYPQETYETEAQRWAPWRVKNRKLVRKQSKNLVNEIFASIKELKQVY